MKRKYEWVAYPLQNPAVIKLARALQEQHEGVPKNILIHAAAGLLVQFMLYAKRHGRREDEHLILRDAYPMNVAFQLEGFTDALERAGLIEENDDGTLIVSNFYAGWPNSQGEKGE